MFARGRWRDALQIVEAFGPNRYNKKQQIALAQTLHLNLGIAFTTAVIVADHLLASSLVALDFNAVMPDQGFILLIAEMSSDSFTHS